MKCLAVAVALSLLASSAIANAQTSNPTRAERSAKSKECAKLADQYGLHGKKRHAFRKNCKKDPI